MALIEALNQRQDRGMKESELEDLTEVDVQKDNKLENCTICLDLFEEGQKRVVLPCKHDYHKDCIIPHLKINEECPLCRKKTKDGLKQQKEQNQQEK